MLVFVFDIFYYIIFIYIIYIETQRWSLMAHEQVFIIDENNSYKYDGFVSLDGFANLFSPVFSIHCICWFKIISLGFVCNLYSVIFLCRYSEIARYAMCLSSQVDWRWHDAIITHISREKNMYAKIHFFIISISAKYAWHIWFMLRNCLCIHIESNLEIFLAWKSSRNLRRRHPLYLRTEHIPEAVTDDEWHRVQTMRHLRRIRRQIKSRCRRFFIAGSIRTAIFK